MGKTSEQGPAILLGKARVFLALAGYLVSYLNSISSSGKWVETRRELPALNEAKDTGKMPGIWQVFYELRRNLSGNEAEYNYPGRVEEKSNPTHSLNFRGQGRRASRCTVLLTSRPVSDRGLGRRRPDLGTPSSASQKSPKQGPGPNKRKGQRDGTGWGRRPTALVPTNPVTLSWARS